MIDLKNFTLNFPLILIIVLLFSCNSNKKEIENKIVSDPEKMDEHSSKSIGQVLGYASEHKGKIDDSTRLEYLLLTNRFYSDNDFNNMWSSKEKWQPLADSLFGFIKDAQLYGLFPGDYHAKNLEQLKEKLDTDSAERKNALQWAKAGADEFS